MGLDKCFYWGESVYAKKIAVELYINYLNEINTLLINIGNFLIGKKAKLSRDTKWLVRNDRTIVPVMPVSNANMNNAVIEAAIPIPEEDGIQLKMYEIQTSLLFNFLGDALRYLAHKKEISINSDKNNVS